ncbi:MAG TPA: ABC transporter permease [Mycobacteriales bacterium]|nr:ABC transporter permease [Mycobacteriales bacterium]
MLGFAVRRIAIAIPVLLAATFFIQLCLVFAGNPLADLRTKNPPVPAQTLHQISHSLHYDTNFFNRYWLWLKGLFSGTFGPHVPISGTSSGPIGRLLEHRLGVTVYMVFGAMILAVIFAIITGVVSATRQYSAVDYGSTFFSFLFISMPAFWFAALLKTWAIQLNDAAGTHIATIGDSTPALAGGTWAHFTDRLSHLVLPALSLSLISYAAWSRYQRASMLEVLNSDYIRLARAKGLSSRRVLVRHALRNALVPLTTVVALDVGAIFGGAVITETVFAWHGMGELFIQAVHTRDVNVVLGWLLISGLFVIMFNLIADLLYAALDPRIRYA